MVKPDIPAPGEIWWMNMSPSAGKEQKGQHPALCLSDFRFNKATGFAYFAPITTVGNAARGTGFAVSLTGAGTETTGVIQVDQIRSFDWRDRGGKRSTDVVPAAILIEVLERFAPVLGLGVLESEEEGDDHA
ncbi:mRNA-degrading endonuclease toxin of MazEF toxin-antitoxin module [Devosia sp. UYZn731]|uniref:type II toxin-antitoxin system PemK/MazF family toxin n=1 Tax=Devosia sp. UYZn731 TaxID=3156345 RepID=UPI003392180E